MLDYAVYAKNNSLYNTPSSFAIYVSGLVLEWIKEVGGLEEIARINHEKADLLYDAIDKSKLFFNDISKQDRSLMNVMFSTLNDELDERFIKFALTYNCDGIKGHRLTKGCRASIYNAMSIEGVQTLVQCMNDFEVQLSKESTNV